ncbi:MAG: NfeD family protein [Campylobacterales bacterium]|nr:NfeD family protein [Campylobacterales bacterium]
MTTWMIWALLAIVAFIIEASTTTFFAFFVGLGFACSAGVAFFDGSYSMQILTSIVGMLIGIYMYKKSKLSTSDISTVGQSNDYANLTGTALKSFDESSTGIVKLNEPYLGTYEWSARSISGAISENDIVHVHKVSGNVLLVSISTSKNKE